MANPAPPLDLSTIERLATKVSALVKLLERTQAELSQARDDNGRLTTQVEALQKRLDAAQREGVTEVQALRHEREQVRTRVTEMLEQIEGLNL